MGYFLPNHFTASRGKYVKMSKKLSITLPDDLEKYAAERCYNVRDFLIAALRKDRENYNFLVSLGDLKK